MPSPALLSSFSFPFSRSTSAWKPLLNSLAYSVYRGSLFLSTSSESLGHNLLDQPGPGDQPHPVTEAKGMELLIGQALGTCLPLELRYMAVVTGEWE